MRYTTALCLFLLLSSTSVAYAQVGLPLGAPSSLMVGPGVRLPADTSVSRLQKSLASFLAALSPLALTTASTYLPQPARPEDAALLDELQGLTQSRRALADVTYTTQLLGAVPLDSGRYLVQLACLGLAGTTPVVRATYDLLARPGGASGFYFSSPLRANTRGWPITQLGNFVFRGPTAPDRPAAKAYARQATSYDRLLGAPKQLTEVFCCADLPTALRLLGVHYKADYAGSAHNSLSARTPAHLLVLYGEGPLAQFDPHDLWHQRLRNVVPAATINKPVDEGCAFLYGGSWGLSWAQILTQFQAWVAAHPNRDWLAAYDSFANVSTTPRKPLLEAYVLNALLVQQLAQQKGFGAVRQLLACGPYEKSNDNYFRVLGEVAGITRENFNIRITQLIRASHP